MLGLETPAEDTGKEEQAQKKEGIGKCWHERDMNLGSFEVMVEKLGEW